MYEIRVCGFILQSPQESEQTSEFGLSQFGPNVHGRFQGSSPFQDAGGEELAGVWGLRCCAGPVPLGLGI